MHVCIRFAGPAIERAERAYDIADVCVVDVPVDDVRDDCRVVFSLANLVCSEADADEILRLEKGGAVLARQALAR
jgi:hypothetical protein